MNIQDGMRRGLHCFVLAICLMLTACATAPFPAPASGPSPLLTQVQTLNGARIISRLGSFSTSPKINEQGYLTWLFPTAVRGNGSYLYIVDSGRGQIFQYDWAQQGMFVFADVHGENVTAIDVASDMSIYAADSKAHTVLHFSWDGKLLQTFSNSRELGRPVAIIADNLTGQVIVADGLYNQIVVFSSLGRLLSVVRIPQTRSIAAMARGPDGLYLVDRLSRKIVVAGIDGLERYIFGSDTLKDPIAVAVDQYNRVFVSDAFDNTIKVYDQGRWRATFGGTGATPGSFNRSSSLWLDRNMLYVADSLNLRIQVFRIAPPEAN
jgi:DNA-binding beta-propeller fold protein YncE